MPGYKPPLQLRRDPYKYSQSVSEKTFLRAIQRCIETDDDGPNDATTAEAIEIYVHKYGDEKILPILEAYEKQRKMKKDEEKRKQELKSLAKRKRRVVALKRCEEIIQETPTTVEEICRHFHCYHRLMKEGMVPPNAVAPIFSEFDLTYDVEFLTAVRDLLVNHEPSVGDSDASYDQIYFHCLRRKPLKISSLSTIFAFSPSDFLCFFKYETVIPTGRALYALAKHQLKTPESDITHYIDLFNTPKTRLWSDREAFRLAFQEKSQLAMHLFEIDYYKRCCNFEYDFKPLRNSNDIDLLILAVQEGWAVSIHIAMSCIFHTMKDRLHKVHTPWDVSPKTLYDCFKAVRGRLRRFFWENVTVEQFKDVIPLIKMSELFEFVDFAKEYGRSDLFSFIKEKILEHSRWERID